jgi:hypothetical protein
MQMLKLSQMLKLLARNMTFSFQKQALSLRDMKVTKNTKRGIKKLRIKSF